MSDGDCTSGGRAAGGALPGEAQEAFRKPSAVLDAAILGAGA